MRRISYIVKKNMTYFDAFILIGGTHKIISFIKPSIMPQSLNEVYYSFKNGSLKTYRLIYLPLIVLMFKNPEFSLRTILMILGVELTFILVPKIVNKIFDKLKF